MRELPTAIVVAVGVHVVVLAAIAGRSAKPATVKMVAVAELPTVTPTPAPAEPEPMTVTLFDDDPVGAIAVADVRPATAHVAHAGQSLAITTASGGTDRNALAAAPPTHSDLMTMRHPEVTRGLSGDFLDQFLSHTKPLAPKDLASEQLADDVARDRANLDNPRYVANATPDELGAQRIALDAHRREQQQLELHPAGGGAYEDGGAYDRRKPFTAHVDPDGTVHFEDHPNLQLGGGDGAIASFDVGDWMMRRHGQDPYASSKLAMLDRTRAQRVELGKRYRHDQLAHSTERMQENLAWLWASTPELAARKQGVFELWDECAERGDAELVAGGASARAFVIGFVRGKLIGADAFTADELARLNAHRQSAAVFAPYAE